LETVRLELVRFLLAEGRVDPALAELVALSIDLPEDDASRAEIGHLFLQAGDGRRALDELEMALQIEPDDPDALGDAGLAAFQIGDYAEARQYLRRAAERRGDVGDRLEVVERVLAGDPLAVRIGAAARRRRLADAFGYADGRLGECVDRRAAGDEPTGDDLRLRNEARAFKRRLTPQVPRDEDVVEEGVDLVYRIASHVADVCPPATPLDRALMLIGRRHEADQP
jgi:tetratricopeptide (TPR) repeat protein